jgi:hypothetical protein
MHLFCPLLKITVSEGFREEYEDYNCGVVCGTYKYTLKDNYKFDL